MKSADVQGRMTALGAEAKGSTPEELAAYIRSELEKMQVLVKASGTKVE